MHHSWQLKRELADSVSNLPIDEIYEAGRQAGAVGGKLLGAGGGGFMVLLVDPEKRNAVRERLRKLIHVDVGFDDEGSKIIIYQPDTRFKCGPHEMSTDDGNSAEPHEMVLRVP